MSFVEPGTKPDAIMDVNLCLVQTYRGNIQGVTDNRSNIQGVTDYRDNIPKKKKKIQSVKKMDRQTETIIF